MIERRKFVLAGASAAAMASLPVGAGVLQTFTGTGASALSNVPDSPALPFESLIGREFNAVGTTGVLRLKLVHIDNVGSQGHGPQFTLHFKETMGRSIEEETYAMAYPDATTPEFGDALFLQPGLKGMHGMAPMSLVAG